MTLTLTPELEAVLEQTVRNGRFATREEAAAEAMKNAITALDPEASLPEEERQRRALLRSKTLVELFRKSPFYGLDIEFPRDHSPMRDVDF